MDFSEAMQWWDEWQLRILVLGSLFLQYFLAIASRLRKLRIPPWFRFLIWLAYLGSDAIAIYALATLFNRRKKQEWMSTNLEVVWAPILLMHLGGQDGITAYNMEDNELWRRHVLTSLSQVTVAIYVFCKSWPGEDKRLLQAAIVVFVPGILKCFDKPWALKNASITSLTSSSGSEGGQIKSLHEYVEAATQYVEHARGGDDEVDEEPYNLFVDIAYPYDVRLKNLKCMVRNQDKAHRLVQWGLSSTFDRLYTKEQVSRGIQIITERSWKGTFGTLLRFVVGYIPFAAIALFHKSHREAYDDTDVKVTYTLLCCTAALEHLIILRCAVCLPCVFCLVSCLNSTTNVTVKVTATDLLRNSWPDHVAQYNLLGYLVRHTRHAGLMKLATLLACKDSLDQLWCMKPCKSSSSEITKLVYGHVRKGWKEYINNIATYRAFSDNRGQWTLQKERCLNLEESLRRPFDESVLVWHLATDFCFYSTDMAGGSPQRQAADRSREMSNYMVYLLFVNPEMLMTGTRQSLFRVAYGQLKDMFRDNISLDEGEITKKIIQQAKDLKGPSQDPGFIVGDARVLAEALMRLDQERRWRVIQGVWVEMLCFSASRCRGYLHAKSLGKGGEYLSYVWLLLSYMGMETLAEKMQRTELPEEGNEGAAGRPDASFLGASDEGH